MAEAKLILLVDLMPPILLHVTRYSIFGFIFIGKMLASINANQD
jgi:hypothetical protein